MSTAAEDDPRPHLRRLLDRSPAARAMIRAAECVLISREPLPSGTLDLGCGDGTLAEALGRVDLVGVDLDRDAVREARSAGQDRVVVADGAALPFRAGAFPGVLANSTLEHTEDPLPVLVEIARVAAPGAPVVVTVPVPAFRELLLGTRLLGHVSQRAAGAYGRFFDRISRHRHVHPTAWWAEHLAAAGFRIEASGDYFSGRSLRTFDALHWSAAPVAIPARSLVGRWTWRRTRGRRTRLVELLADRIDLEPSDGRPGAYGFVRARRADG
jgi:SAM-dependent methyltransferase